MFFSSNNSKSPQPKTILKHYRRLMVQFKKWEKNCAALEENQGKEFLKTLNVELKTIQKFYKAFINDVLIPFDQQPALPEIITQEDISSLLRYKEFMPFFQLFAEREAWMQRIAGTDGTNASASETYCQFKHFISNHSNKFVIEESLNHFEQGTLRYHHECQAAKRKIDQEFKSLRDLYERLRESKNKADMEIASILNEFIDQFAHVPYQLRLREEIQFKQSEPYIKALSKDKFTAALLLSQHLRDYSNTQEELAERMKLLQSLSRHSILFEQNNSPLGRLKTRLHITPPASQKLSSLEHALKFAENAFKLYKKHTELNAEIISLTAVKNSEITSDFFSTKPAADVVSESQNTSPSIAPQPEMASVERKRPLGKVHLKVREYEENLLKLGVFHSKKPLLTEPVKSPVPFNENKFNY
ncbi:EbhA protein [Fluoribacter dumoffii]|uniref:EbhA protein n=1 Tax=Fluoribacter dumoffii TaxID=463 RepID=UPI0022438A42|nr:EbhA protein [Fluoribacter dumoffii]MCW8483009.1 EbhA protein [Fluoribacter dumoffii]